MNSSTFNLSPDANSQRGVPSTVLYVLLAAATAVVVWSYWTPLGVMTHKWTTDPQYSHGWLVPLFALLLLWWRRDRLQSRELRPGWWGIPLILFGISLRLYGGYFYFEWLELLSFVPVVGGVCLTLGGLPSMAWAWPSVVSLIFMVPLAHSVESMLREPLRLLGTQASTYALQTIGVPAYAEGFVIVVEEQKLDIEEACSGLRMLMVFFALSTAVAFLAEERRLWERAVVLLSAIPIAIISNVVRITVVGLLFHLGHVSAANSIHEHAEFLMMPVALGLLWIELRVLSALFIVEHISPMSVGLETVNVEHAVEAREGRVPDLVKAEPR